MFRRPKHWPALMALPLAACSAPAPCPPTGLAEGRGAAVPEGSVDPRDVEFAPGLDLDLDRGSVLLEGLYCLDTAGGSGEPATPGATVTVDYTGYLPDGTIFDTSVEREPFSLLLGAGQVIPGWEFGLGGMRVGGRRRIVIPPHLAYGTQGAGGVIPPNAVLVFDVELLEMD